MEASSCRERQHDFRSNLCLVGSYLVRASANCRPSSPELWRHMHRVQLSGGLQGIPQTLAPFHWAQVFRGQVRDHGGYLGADRFVVLADIPGFCNRNLRKLRAYPQDSLKKNHSLQTILQSESEHNLRPPGMVAECAHAVINSLSLRIPRTLIDYYVVYI